MCVRVCTCAYGVCMCACVRVRVCVVYLGYVLLFHFLFPQFWRTWGREPCGIIGNCPDTVTLRPDPGTVPCTLRFTWIKNKQTRTFNNHESVIYVYNCSCFPDRRLLFQVSLCICPSICVFVYLSVRLSVCLSLSVTFDLDPVKCLYFVSIFYDLIHQRCPSHDCDTVVPEDPRGDRVFQHHNLSFV